MNSFIKYIAITLLLVSCSSKEKDAFTYLNADKTSIIFSNELENTKEINILNYLYFYNGAGVASGDFNNDGYSDLYFTSNLKADKLYLNKGDLTFIDITDKARISNSDGFSTGVTTVDINNDGLLDIYICKVTDVLNDLDRNLLYVNQGIVNGVPTFKEQAKRYNLDIASYATQASFFDYDLDGDLDMFLLNHSVKPNRSYGKGSKRKEISQLYGDKLFENIDSKFVDVTEHSKIFQGGIGYGLGVSISDVNNDGYPDIYVGNDFFENDYLYINQKNKAFKEVISTDPTSLGHTTHFSMGNTLSDLNNDGLSDILSVDMLPEDLFTLKTSAPEYNYPINSNYLKNGYAPQFMQNSLHINRENNMFSEIGHLSGIAATEWSWSPLVADFDNDGLKDIYITNGILGATNDMDFINFISDEKIQKAIDKGVREDELKLINEIPSKKTANYFFKNNGDLTFSNKSDSWVKPTPTYSNGAITTDLDNDGDLDIVVNNVNEPADIIINNNNEGNYLKVRFEGSENNIQGVGAKVIIYVDSNMQMAENFPTKGFLSANDAILHFGLGEKQIIDSLKVIWPDKKVQLVKKVATNKIVKLKHAEASLTRKEQDSLTKIKVQFPKIDFTHKENTTLDFNRDALIPYSNASLGPAITVADINNDDLDDLFIGGAKGQSSKLFIQETSGNFITVQDSLFLKTAINEDVSAVFKDLNQDGFPELIITSAGNEFKTGKPIQPILYWNNKGVLEYDANAFEGINGNISKISFFDVDQDQDQDIILLSNTTPEQFGKTPQQYILRNNGSGNFSDATQQIAPALQYLGNLTDITFGDFDNNGKTDFVISGHWLPITLFEIENGVYKQKEIVGFKKTNGWWNTLQAADFDNDGDLDIIAGNWGENTRLKATKDESITLYANDFDNNGKVDPLITYFYKGEETTFASKEELAKQMPFINKKFLTHKDFANASVEEIFGKKNLKNADVKLVNTLSSTYFENQGNLTFKAIKLPKMAQISSVNNITVNDFNSDGYFDILLTGNHYEISTQLSRLDASHGELFINDKKGGFYYKPTPLLNISGVASIVDFITIANKKYIIVGVNNDAPLIIPFDLIKH